MHMRDKRYPEGHPLRPYILPGFYVKMLGTLFFALIYQFYYSDRGHMGGDTYLYFLNSKTIAQCFFTDPEAGFEMLMIKGGEYTTATLKYTIRMEGFINNESHFMYKLGSFIQLLGLFHYLPVGMFFGLFAFTGQLRIMDVFFDEYPKMAKQLALATLFIPSVAFWGSSIMKDTVCLGALGWMFYASYNLTKLKKIAFNIFTLCLAAWLILILKAYIVLAFVPAITAWFFLSYLKKVEHPALKIFAFFILGAVGGVLGFIMLNTMASMSERYKLDELEKMAKGFHSYHGHLAESGASKSGYTIHFTDFTPIGMLKVLPEAVNVTLFRPYLWEARSPVIMASALESTALFIYTLYLLYLAGLWGFIKSLFNPDVLLCMIFSIILGFATGITAFNFGALVRFKIPLMPFFLSGLLIMGYSIRLKKEDIKAMKEANAKNA